MDITVSHRLYNSFGGHKSISLVSALLEYEMPDFGDAIQEIDITVHFYHDGPARNTLEKMQEEFHKNLEKLPKCTFSRKKQRLSLEIEGKFTTGYEIERNKKPLIQVNPAWVKATLEEIIGFAPIINPKIKKTDNFDFPAFEVYLNSTLSTIPDDVEELENIRDIVAQRRKEAFNKLDDWKKLGLDWEDYHPKAREVVPIPNQWSCADEFSPNGSDTGADTLEIFRKWNKRNGNNSTLIFLAKLLRDWEIDINDPYQSEYSSYTYFQTVTGLAFASAKIRGKCEQELKDKAVAAINEYLGSIEDKTGWEYKNECKEKLHQSKQTIEKMPNKEFSGVSIALNPKL
ncbi:hypothetical protein [Shewanella sp. MEBiC00475]|uniref:hypothetical protein n=1 Tax=Shewanella sp. MEBiC00475 TaxID=2575361 RepID=UPI0010C072E6|nr:hypothetical protein [Shewanella sp. MEBiC00475]